MSFNNQIGSWEGYKTKKCIYCKSEIQEDAKTCKYCNKSQTEVKTKAGISFKTPKRIAIALYSLASITCVIGLFLGIISVLLPDVAEEIRYSVINCTGKQADGIGNIISKAFKAPKDNLIKECKECNYKEILRNPQRYKDTKIKITTRIKATGEGVVGYGDTCYLSLVKDDSGWYGNKYILIDLRENGDKITEGETLTIYGEFVGAEKVSSDKIKTDTEVPIIKMYYADKQ